MADVKALAAQLWFVALLTGVPGLPPAEAHDPEAMEEGGEICVLIRNAEDRTVSMMGAEVFTLGCGEEETILATQGRLGGACFAAPVSLPKYLFVRHEGYFIGGVETLSGAKEYYVLLVQQAVP